MDWNKKYDSEVYRYGKKPVDFLTRTVDGLKPGRALCVGAGEGRNAVWLAEQGWAVTALDQSEIGLEKARSLAAERGVELEAVVADAASWEMGEDSWDLITLFFVHPPEKIRKVIHQKAAGALAPGGRFVLEGFTPRQIGKGTGGPDFANTDQAPPPDAAARFIEPEIMHDELPGLEMELLEEVEIELVGGTHHSGEGAVVHVVAVKN